MEDGDELGVELDGEIVHSLNDSTHLSLKGAALLRSDVLDALSGDESDEAWAVLFSIFSLF